MEEEVQIKKDESNITIYPLGNFYLNLFLNTPFIRIITKNKITKELDKFQFNPKSIASKDTKSEANTKNREIVSEYLLRKELTIVHLFHSYFKNVTSESHRLIESDFYDFISLRTILVLDFVVEAYFKRILNPSELDLELKRYKDLALNDIIPKSFIKEYAFIKDKLLIRPLPDKTDRENISLQRLFLSYYDEICLSNNTIEGLVGIEELEYNFNKRIQVIKIIRGKYNLSHICHDEYIKLEYDEVEKEQFKNIGENEFIFKQSGNYLKFDIMDFKQIVFLICDISSIKIEEIKVANKIILNISFLKELIDLIKISDVEITEGIKEVNNAFTEENLDVFTEKTNFLAKAIIKNFSSIKFKNKENEVLICEKMKDVLNNNEGYKKAYCYLIDASRNRRYYNWWS